MIGAEARVTLWIAYGPRAGSLREIVLSRLCGGTISLGNDTDTTACVAGGIAGLRYGIHGIPARWREGLRGRDLVEPLLDRLIRHRTGE